MLFTIISLVGLSTMVMKSCAIFKNDNLVGTRLLISIFVFECQREREREGRHYPFSYGTAPPNDALVDPGMVTDFAAAEECRRLDSDAFLNLHLRTDHNIGPNQALFTHLCTWMLQGEKGMAR